MNKILKLVLFFLCLIILFSGCSFYNEKENIEDSKNENDKVGINFFLNTPEYLNAFNTLIEEYEKLNPNIEINIEVLQSDYPSILKAKIASNSIPDVFSTMAVEEIKSYSEYSADLTNETFVRYMNDEAKRNMTYDEKILGVPFKKNCFGIVYNKKLFREANIDKLPKTTDELKVVCEKLNKIGVTPFANAYKEWWVQKNIFQHFLVAENPDVSVLINEFEEGKTTFSEHSLLYNYFDFLNLTIEYGTPKPLEKDYNYQINAFYFEKVAMLTGQGIWVENELIENNKDLELGIMGYPINDDSSKSSIIVGTDRAIRLYKNSEVLEETKDLFNWLYTSEYGNFWFENVAKVIPPVDNVENPDLQIAEDMEIIMANERISDVATNYSLDSFHQRFGEIIQSYIAKEKTEEEAIGEIEKNWIKIKSN
jgi:raffinose/stachyose/melibiose transport system substrate-binding protein